MNYRQSILITALQNVRRVYVNEFLEEFNISYRTLKNDVDELNHEMKCKIITIDHDTVEPSEYEKFVKISMNLMKESDSYKYKMSSKERSIIASIILLYSNDYKTAKELSDNLSVSRGTIINDMKTMSKIIRKYNLKLDSKTNYGFRILGTEKQVRRYLNDIVNQEFLSSNRTYIMLLDKQIAGNVDINLIYLQIVNQIEQGKLPFTDKSFKKILNTILIIINRIQQGHKLQERITQTVDQRYRLLLEQLSKNYFPKEEINDSELSAFNKTLEEVFEQGKEYENCESEGDEQIKILAFIWNVCADLDILQQVRYQNYNLLCNHIISTLSSLKADLNLQPNPFYNELEIIYPDIFASVRKNIHIIEEINDKKISDNEMSYIVMHFAAIVEANKNLNRSLHCILVCPNGNCASLLLKARIVKYFNVAIDDLLPAYMVNYKNDINADFIISTVPLENVKLPVVVVSPMFLQKDLDKMQEFLHKINKLSKQKTVISRIQNYIKEYQMITSEHDDSVKHINALNKRYMRGPETNEKSYFYKMLKPEHIMLDAKTKTLEDALRISGDILLNKGYITSSYIETMIQLIHENGPYIVFEPGFVIAHAGPHDGALKLGVSMVRLANTIQMENKINIKFVLCLSIPDRKSHVFLLFQIYKCLTNRKIFNILSEAKSTEEIISILHIFETRDESESNI